MRLTKKSKAVVAGVSMLGLVGTGTAYAYWSTSGSGTGTATTSTGAASLLVSQGTAISNMYPGDAAQSINGTVKNTAANSAYVTAVTASITVTPLGAGTCDATDYTLASPIMAVGSDVAAGATVPFSGATLKFNNKATNQDGCKGATVNLTYTAS